MSTSPKKKQEKHTLEVQILGQRLLLLDRQDLGREQALQPEDVALLGAEGEVLVQEARPKERLATQVDGRRPAGDDGVVRRRQWSHGTTLARPTQRGAGHPDRRGRDQRADR